MARLSFCFLAVAAVPVEAARVKNGAVAAARADVAANETLGWSPCARSMCYAGLGGNKQPGVTGRGGTGQSGCASLFGNCDRGHSRMICAFGICPQGFYEGDDCISNSKCRSYCDVQHKDSCRYSGPVIDTDHSKWMSEFSDVPLNKLLMVEGHHVLGQLGTLDFKKPQKESEDILRKLGRFSWIPGFGSVLNVAIASLLPMWSSTQSSNTAALLKAGVRGFDVRPHLSKTDGQLHDSHGGLGALVEPSIATMAAFLRNNPSEVVTLNLQNIAYAGDGKCQDCSNGDVWKALTDMLTKHFGTCSSSTALVKCNANIKNTVGSFGGRVIIHSNRDQLVNRANGMVHASRSIYSAPWYDTNNFDSLRNRVLSDTTLQHKSQGDNILIAHQWVLSPTSDDFIGAVTARYTGEYQSKANKHGCQSLACFAEVASAKSFNSAFSAIRSVYKRSNFVMLDYADREGTMAVVIDINRRFARS